MKLKVAVDGVVYEVEVEVEEDPPPALGAVFMTGGSFTVPTSGAPAAGGGGGDASGIRAPLAGSVSRVLVEEGQAIEAGDVVVVLEAMKMETEITAPEAGTVSRVLVAPSDTVTGGQLLVELG
jgi:methylmalonyl-CoA carboxyltransferase 1.3S subunit